MSGRSPPLYFTLTLIVMQEYQTKQNKNIVVVHTTTKTNQNQCSAQLDRKVIIYTTIVPSYHTAIGASVEHKECNDIITDEEWYILVKV